jgi:hypothetical protein
MPTATKIFLLDLLAIESKMCYKMYQKVHLSLSHKLYITNKHTRTHRRARPHADTQRKKSTRKTKTIQNKQH